MATNKAKTVYVGMSGGVDSSVSAALLKEQGFNVVGVFIKAWEPLGFDCGWREDRRDAMRVAAKLDIPFLTIDLSAEYKKEVVDYMISEYKNGRTPNPDVMCNKSIKFGAFFNHAIAAGADYVATGHYARTKEDNIGTKLLAGIDKNKDQSYFLWTLQQNQLSHTIFPIGNLEKSKVRELAEKFELPNSQKKDSQGLCFVGKLDLKDFLREFVDQKEGKVLDVKGEVVGTHDGAALYTLGERHGFTVTEKRPDEKALYVISKDLERNTITVGETSRLDDSVKREIKITKTSWTGAEPEIGKTYSARVRYRQPLEACELLITSSGYSLIFENPQIAAPGQSVVIYDGEVCLGGGVIE